jgi:hypothetical protein
MQSGPIGGIFKRVFGRAFKTFEIMRMDRCEGPRDAPPFSLFALVKILLVAFPLKDADLGGGLERQDARDAKGRGVLDFFTGARGGGQLEGFSSGSLAGHSSFGLEQVVPATVADFGFFLQEHAEGVNWRDFQARHWPGIRLSGWNRLFQPQSRILDFLQEETEGANCRHSDPVGKCFGAFSLWRGGISYGPTAHPMPAQASGLGGLTRGAFRAESPAHPGVCAPPVAFWIGHSALETTGCGKPSPLGWSGMMPGLWSYS